MRRIATTTLIAIVLVSVAGCQEPEQQADLQNDTAQSAMMAPDYYVTDPAASVSDGSYAETYPASEVGTPEAGAAGDASGAIHLAVKGDTLFALARQYYNDQGRWKDIWEANRTTMASPDVISIGQELVIP